MWIQRLKILLRLYNTIVEHCTFETLSVLLKPLLSVTLRSKCSDWEVQPLAEAYALSRQHDQTKVLSLKRKFANRSDGFHKSAYQEWKNKYVTMSLLFTYLECWWDLYGQLYDSTTCWFYSRTQPNTSIILVSINQVIQSNSAQTTFDFSLRKRKTPTNIPQIVQNNTTHDSTGNSYPAIKSQTRIRAFRLPSIPLNITTSLKVSRVKSGKKIPARKAAA